MAYAPAPPLRPARGSPSFPACGTGVLRTRHGRRGIVSASPNALPATPLPTHRRKRNCRMEKRELVIIGAGPAGLSAAIYGKRAGLDTLVLEKGRPGGQVLITSKIENYPGILDGTGSGLADAFRTPCRAFQGRIPHRFRAETGSSRRREDHHAQRRFRNRRRSDHRGQRGQLPQAGLPRRKHIHGHGRFLLRRMRRGVLRGAGSSRHRRRQYGCGRSLLPYGVRLKSLSGAPPRSVPRRPRWLSITP